MWIGYKGGMFKYIESFQDVTNGHYLMVNSNIRTINSYEFILNNIVTELLVRTIHFQIHISTYLTKKKLFQYSNSFQLKIIFY